MNVAATQISASEQKLFAGAKLMEFAEVSRWLADRGILGEEGRPVTERTIRAWIMRGKLPGGWEPARRRRFITEAMLERWWIERQMSPKPPKSVPSRVRASRRRRSTGN